MICYQIHRIILKKQHDPCLTPCVNELVPGIYLISMVLGTLKYYRQIKENPTFLASLGDLEICDGFKICPQTLYSLL